jgi:ABC-2 type transport system permease protein
LRASSPSGSIYDLGYRPYEGKRLGRAYAVQSLYWYTLRSIYGLGRSAGAKVFPFGLAAIAVLPAIVQIGLAAVISDADQIEIISEVGHFRYIRVIVALFCAVAAPELTGRDQRARILTLYFSRALSRADYVTAKLAALITALFLLNFIPQTLLLLGNALATKDVGAYLGDHIADLLPIAASSLAISLVMSCVSMAIASQSPRRAISTVSVLGFFLISLALSDVLINTLSSGSRGFALLIAPMNTLDGFIYWVFNTAPQANSALAKADQDGIVYFLVCIAYIVAGAGWLYRRYQKMSV